MYRWCSHCGETVGKIPQGRILCPSCGRETEVELDPGDTLRIDGKREFRIIRQLSQHSDAGMSAVYLAERTDKPEKRAALKVAKARRLQALKREVYHLQRLKHSQIIRLAYGHRFSEPDPAILRDDIDNERLCYIALEYMDEGSLKDKLREKHKERRFFSLAEATQIVAAVSKALDYAHGQDVVHLDVKPPNILLGSDGRIVLSDFGVTREQSVLDQSARRRMGTLLYNAPEQLKKDVPPDHRVDIYALGLILYEMLAGKNPVYHRTSSSSKGSDREGDTDSSSTDTVRQRIITGDISRPREMNPGIPKSVEQVILTAIAHDREERYDSAGDLTEALRAAGRAETRKRRLKLYLGLAAGSLFVLALVVGIALALLLPSLTPPIATVSPPTPMAVAAPTDDAGPSDPGGVIGEPQIPTSALAAETPTREPETATEMPTPTLAPGETPKPTSTLAAFATATPIPRLDTPRPEPEMTPDATPVAALTEDMGEIELILIAPANGQALDSDRVEFTWRWGEGKRCQPLPPGYGFEIRVWADRPGEEPLGAMDATKNQKDIACDPANGIRAYIMGDIKMAPGVLGANAGTFRWDVAVVQLEPYAVSVSSDWSHGFVIPGISDDGGGGF